MDLSNVLKMLRYDSSPNFFSGDGLESDRLLGHTFRKAIDECGLQGAYVLNGGAYDRSQGAVPLVYVCQANSEAEARAIHCKVWNQNAVPFLLIVSPAWVRLYPGFKYERDVSRDPRRGALEVIQDFNDAAGSLASLTAQSLDSGLVWTQFGAAVGSERRVDWQLLDNLRDLDSRLHADGVTDRKLSHAMIGKFVYLRYLRQRDILSDIRLGEWNILPENVFGQGTQMQEFIKLVAHVDEWLNGGVFPITSAKIREFGEKRIQKVASVFSGEQAFSGQLPLFDVYDFSFIPIETLSVIYERFLHDRLNPVGESEGEAQGAYYTPIPVVNFMLEKLDSHKQLVQGMRVLDCSCGSGAFLVQCYRKLIELRLKELRRRLRPSELGRLLTHHIFGVDIDEDACQIAELSLALTLLEYVNPPDLTATQFQLPGLRQQNIFCLNAFEDSSWYEEATKQPFHWIVGNPPWKELKPKRLSSSDEIALRWIQTGQKHNPVSGNQLAEAFVWRTSTLLAEGGVAALLIPAMTLFKYESMAFRKEFVTRFRLWSVANFANLANVLFGGRATLPAAAIFYSPRCGREDDQPGEERIETYSPMVANQMVSQPNSARARKGIWSLIVNSSEVREIDYREITNGQALPWKIAMWGSAVDLKLLSRTAKEFPAFERFEQEGFIVASQGPEFINAKMANEESSERHDELVGRPTIKTETLKGKRLLFRFPTSSFETLGVNDVFVSKRGGVKRKLSVCDPPHVVLGASRNFAIFTEDFLVVPSRQIGIIAPKGNVGFLKALALYLNSDFVAYHQFFTTTEAGIQKSTSTLESLRSLPIPFGHGANLEPWENLYSKILREAAYRVDFNLPDLSSELNELTADALRLPSRARAAVQDLVKVRFGLTRGKTAELAIGTPSSGELVAYAETLRDDLDAFVGSASNARHRVEIVAGSGSGFVVVSILNNQPTQEPVQVWPASESTAQGLLKAQANLIERRSQWLYFNRNLRVYNGSSTYILKPLQRLHWTRTQAVLDGGEIIADALQAGPQIRSGSIN